MSMPAVESPSRFMAMSALAPKSRVTTAPPVATWKQVLNRPPAPKASPHPTTVSFMPVGSYALALGRAETMSCQRRTCWRCGGSAILVTRMKSTATRPVMSATV